mmetsp:Transcript_30957/g.89141  ORF Transcript_30957/g.89141 Transcript_30957/m.89141 type:complete len:271 (-) Transcript_30957:122-934(-)
MSLLLGCGEWLYLAVRGRAELAVPGSHGAHKQRPGGRRRALRCLQALLEHGLQVHAPVWYCIHDLLKLLGIYGLRLLEHVEELLALDALGLTRPRAALLVMREVAEQAFLAVDAANRSVHVMAGSTPLVEVLVGTRRPRHLRLPGLGHHLHNCLLVVLSQAFEGEAGPLDITVRPGVPSILVIALEVVRDAFPELLVLLVPTLVVVAGRIVDRESGLRGVVGGGEAARVLPVLSCLRRLRCCTGLKHHIAGRCLQPCDVIPPAVAQLPLP